MVLGAGPFQVPVIRKAQAMGCHTIAVSNLPDDPGMAVADAYHLCSTLDQEQVLHLARHEQIHGILTVASEVAAPTVAYVAQQLHLPAYSLQAAETIANKFRLRTFLQEKNLSAIRFAKLETEADIPAALARVPLPAMVKPLLASGSRGIRKITSEADLRATLPQAVAQSYRYVGALLEEFMPGEAYGAEALIAGGKIALLTLSRKFVNEWFVTTGHLLPAVLPKETEALIITLLEKTVAALALSNGALDVDLVLSPAGPEIIEMGGRLGGNNLAELVSLHTGTDWVEQVIKLALAEPLQLDKAVSRRPVAVHLAGSERPGKLKQIRRFEDVFPNYSDSLVAQKDLVLPGSHVSAFTQGSHQLGAFLITHPDQEKLAELLRLVQETPWIELEEARV